jgi:hypothetical protein
MDERGCKQLQAEVDGLLGISKHAVKPKSLFINAPFAQSLRPILASREDINVVDRGGGAITSCVNYGVMPLVKIRTPCFLMSSLVPKKKENMRMLVQTPSLVGRTIRWPSYWQASFYRKL